MSFLIQVIVTLVHYQESYQLEDAGLRESL